MTMNTESVGATGFRPGPFSPFGRQPARAILELTPPVPEMFPLPKERLRARAAAGGVDPSAGSRPSMPSPSPAARTGTTASQASLDQYRRKGQQLLNMFRRETGAAASMVDISPLDWVTWLLSRKPTLKSTTWRFYRVSAIHFLEGFPGDTAAALTLLENDFVDHGRPPATRAPGAQKRTSAQKEKRLPIGDFEKLSTFLSRFSRSRLAPVVVDWLRAGILTGLRPTEWQATDLDVQADPEAPRGRRALLYVLNAKATNGRGTGIVRTLDISAFADPDLECVRRMSDLGRLWLEAGTYSEMQSNCASVLAGANARIWPTRRTAYTLYSCRHQAVANWKQVLRPEEVAALVGHGVTATAAEHYGKRRSGWAAEHIPVPPQPVEEELRQVRATMKRWDERFALERQAGLRAAGDVPGYPVG